MRRRGASQKERDGEIIQADARFNEWRGEETGVAKLDFGDEKRKKERNKEEEDIERKEKSRKRNGARKIGECKRKRHIEEERNMRSQERQKETLKVKIPHSMKGRIREHVLYVSKVAR